MGPIVKKEHSIIHTHYLSHYLLGREMHIIFLHRKDDDIAFGVQRQKGNNSHQCFLEVQALKRLMVLFSSSHTCSCTLTIYKKWTLGLAPRTRASSYSLENKERGSPEVYVFKKGEALLVVNEWFLCSDLSIVRLASLHLILFVMFTECSVARQANAF